MKAYTLYVLLLALIGVLTLGSVVGLTLAGHGEIGKEVLGTGMLAGVLWGLFGRRD